MENRTVKILIEIYKEEYRSAPKIIFKESYNELDTLARLGIVEDIIKELKGYRKELGNSLFKKLAT